MTLPTLPRPPVWGLWRREYCEITRFLKWVVRVFNIFAFKLSYKNTPVPNRTHLLKNKNTQYKNMPPHKKRIDIDKLKQLNKKGLSQTEIAKQLKYSQPHISYLMKKIGLKATHPSRFHLPSDKKVYSEHKIGKMSVEELSKKYNINVFTIKVKIGRHLMELCRVSEECPYKALLPEYMIE